MGRKLVQQQQQDDEGAGKKPRRRSRRRTAGLWAMRGVFVLAFLALLTGFMVIGQRMHAPAWLRDRVETRLDEALGGVKVRFGDVSFIVHEGWRPRMRLTDVRISDAAGQQIAEVSDLRASLSMRPLLRGHVRPKRIILQGAQIALTRGLDGVLTLTVGAGSAPVGQAPNFAQLIERSDEVFQSPALSALSSVELDAITLDYQDLRLGRSWVLDGGRIQATRSAGEVRLATNFSVLAGRDFVSTIEANYTSSLGSLAARFGISITDLPAEDIAGHSPVLAWMQVLRTPISGALRGSIDADGALGPVFATLNLGAGAVQPTPETTPIKFDSARTYFTYDPIQQALDFNEVSISSAWGRVQADGKAFLQGIKAGALDSMSGQFRLSGIEVNPVNLFPEALNLTRADVDFQMMLAPFRMQLGQMTVEDGSHRARLSGSLAGLSEGWVAEIDAQIDQMKSDQLLNYWPERLAPKPRLWVTENLYHGEMSDLDFALRLRPGEKPDIYVDFEFEDTKVRFAKTLPPIENAQGQASLLNGRFTVSAQKGIVIADEGGAVDASGTSFIIPDTRIKKSTPGIARVQAKGSVTAALSLLDRPPLQLLTKANLPVELADGQVSLGGTLSLPLIKGLKLEDTQFHFSGKLSNLDSDKLVPGFEVSADQLDLSGDQTQVAIEGEGLFGVVPVQASWRQPIGGDTPQRSELTGQIELSPRLMEQINAGLPNGMLTGQGLADFTLGIGAGEPPRLNAQSDLVGVALAIPELGWRKGGNSSGILTAEATLGAQLSVDALRIDTAGLRTSASISFRDGAFDRVRFSSFELGNWLAVPAELIGRGSALPDIRVLGGVLDLGKSTLGEGGGDSGGGGGPGPKLDVALDRLQVTETVALTGLTGSFQTTGGLTGPFAAQVNGGARINGQVTPRDGRTAVGLTSDDAGAVLRSAGVLTQARGGSMQLQLDPIAEPGNYDVDLKIKNTRITDAPAMAALLNAISLVGLLDEMAGQGIFFSAIDSKMRITPTEVKVLSGSAVGPSMGLSFDGTVDTVAGMLNLRGAISPIYLLNAIGSVITKKGEGIFSFNYTLTGPLADPRVSVNPLSGLAPLFLRNLLREPAPTVSDGPNATPDRSGQPHPAVQSRGEDR
ncbi:DUF3971 domain-containing protein [uncultured Ruegeria sp.]|uniref:YhdP family protein n=1 Tax=uncultured Ruegeria sp. TaxID=259304 RepID=UPI00261F7E9C|nr:DUF3971 domain-containing protein [uncultured Ruegeria sp.]